MFIPNWKEVEILAKENNIVKRKFKESVATLQGKKDNRLNKKEERTVISDIWSAIITQIKVNQFFILYGQINQFLIVNKKAF